MPSFERYETWSSIHTLSALRALVRETAKLPDDAAVSIGFFAEEGLFGYGSIKVEMPPGVSLYD